MYKNALFFSIILISSLTFASYKNCGFPGALCPAAKGKSMSQRIGDFSRRCSLNEDCCLGMICGGNGTCEYE